MCFLIADILYVLGAHTGEEGVQSSPRRSQQLDRVAQSQSRFSPSVLSMFPVTLSFHTGCVDKLKACMQVMLQ